MATIKPKNNTLSATEEREKATKEYLAAVKSFEGLSKEQILKSIINMGKNK